MEITKNNEEKAICVYVKAKPTGEIYEINSELFIVDFDGWIKIDEGFGDKYAHAQSQYYDKPLVDDEGNFNYRLDTPILQ